MKPETRNRPRAYAYRFFGVFFRLDQLVRRQKQVYAYVVAGGVVMMKGFGSRCLAAFVARLAGLPNDRQGGVMMEYVLLTLVFILPLIGVSFGLVNANGQVLFAPADAVTGEDFGLVGNAIVDRCRMIMCGLCLPLP